MTDAGATGQPPARTGVTPGGEDRHRDVDEYAVYPDKTLVLVGCGKAKRDPEDPTDRHVASVPEGEPLSAAGRGDTAPAWEAQDLYTSSYFASKRTFAKAVTQWARSYPSNPSPWTILSAEHRLLYPWQDVTPYDTTITDLGDDPMTEAGRVETQFGERRPDGREVVTEMDYWARMVAFDLARWVSSFRPMGAYPWECDANTLLVLAGESYVEPLRERGVFEYGIARMVGDPNQGFTLPIDVQFPFAEIDAGGNGEQMAWLSDQVSRFEREQVDRRQTPLGEFDGTERTCDACGASDQATELRDYDIGVYCEDDSPRRCARCDEWTQEVGLGTYPLCPDCQTERGGQKRDPVGGADPTDQAALDVPLATDGGDAE